MESLIKVFIIAMSPILELRGSIPIGLGVFKLPVWEVFFVSILGNLIPVILILRLLDAVSKFLMRRFYFFNRFFTWLFSITRQRHEKKFQVLKNLALVFLVAIPLPFTGAWTGSLCAFLFGIPWKKAFSLIAIGVLIAGFIVTLTTLGIISLI